MNARDAALAHAIKRTRLVGSPHQMVDNEHTVDSVARNVAADLQLHDPAAFLIACGVRPRELDNLLRGREEYP